MAISSSRTSTLQFEAKNRTNATFSCKAHLHHKKNKMHLQTRTLMFALPQSRRMLRTSMTGLDKIAVARQHDAAQSIFKTKFFLS